ncbi:MAG: zf-HC2 domain-containing protein [Candidatus Krumholzibacteriota bacterium]|nr:zf-HC2 domain-containing protein [Candidatus Krumholzibacteriota bacterium]
MSERCEDIRKLMEDHLAGELGPEDLARLREHCADCADCRELAALHGLLSRAGEAIPVPDADAFRAMRARVLREVRRPRARRAMSELGRDLARLARLHPVAAPALVALLLAAALLAGRWSAAPATLDDDLLRRAVQNQAARSEGLEGFWDSPLSLANVTVRPALDGRLALSFDVCQHVEMAADRRSPVVREVLLHAILEPSALGTRLQAMDLTEEVADPALLEALVFTLHHDPALAVRLEALRVLSRHPFDAGVREALLTTLRRDESVQMRLSALEILAGREVDRDIIQRAIREDGQESDAAVLQYASELGCGL